MKWFFLLIISCSCFQLSAQTNDSLIHKNNDKDSLAASPKVKKHNPRKATLYSTFVPGLGQYYNKEYWKIPIVIAALSIPTYTYFYNDKYYQMTKFAYEARYKQSINPADTADIARIDPLIKNLNLNSLRNYRNEFRQGRDYSVLWFVIVWGLNIVDATVFGHLKDFNVNDNLSMHIEPKASPSFDGRFSGTVAMSFQYKKKKQQFSSGFLQ